MSERWPDLAGRIEDGTHVLPVRVYFEDTDFSGVAYHASYFRWCERGRSDLLRLVGIGHAGLHAPATGDESLAFAVTHIEADFVGAARIDDVLEVRTRFAGMTGARLTLGQEVRRAERAIFRAAVTVALLGSDGRPRRLAPLFGDRLRTWLP